MLNFFKKARKKIFSCSYAQTYDLLNDRVSDAFCVSFENGFAFYDGLSGTLKNIVQSPYRGTNFISTINSSNIVAIVPQGECSIHIWDRFKSSFLCIIPIRERTRITGLRFRPDCIFVVSLNSISVINLYDQNQMSSVVTASNPYGAFDFPPSFSSEYAVILSPSVGSFTFYSYISPDVHFPDIQAFQKDINVLKMSPNAKIVAVASLGNHKIKCYHVPNGEESLTIALPISESGAAAIEFDRYDSSLFIITPSNVLYLFSLEDIDLNSRIDPSVTLHYDAYFYLPDHQFFWAHYASESDTIVIVSHSGGYQKIGLNKNKKSFDVIKKIDLDFNFPQ